MDMLIKLYGLADRDTGAIAPGCSIRKPIGPEHARVVAWVAERFGTSWASEAQVALANRPVSLFIALRDETLLGFACYDATARGFVGPIGIAEAARGAGLGAALLTACLRDMRAMGYGYAVAGAVGAAGFFERVAGATEIPGSTPGVYRGMLRR